MLPEAPWPLESQARPASSAPPCTALHSLHSPCRDACIDAVFAASNGADRFWGAWACVQGVGWYASGGTLLRRQTCAARPAPRAKCCSTDPRGPPRLTACGAADPEWGELERGLFVGEGDDLGPGWGQLGLAEPPNAGGESASQQLEAEQMAGARHCPSTHAADPHFPGGGRGAGDAASGAAAAPVSSDVVIIIDD